MRVMMIAGEASGDLHGSGVIRALKRCMPAVEVYGIGGDKMRAEGMELVFHVREVSVMGFVEVVRHLPVIRSVERTLEALLTARRPDVVLLIDYPGFNLRFARKAHRLGVRVLYYISPQVWAWRPGRLRKMKGVVDKMFVVFPFEEELYKRAGIDVDFVGHPLLEVLGSPQAKTEFCRRHALDSARPVVGLFPGSREQELKRLFPPMLEAGKMLAEKHGAQIAVGAASILAFDFVKSFMDDGSSVKLLQNATYDLMANSDVALVTSGTATLETAYFGTPMVVAYRTSWLTYLLGRMLVRIRNIGLVNIVAGKTVVPELLQASVTPRRLASAASRFLTDKALALETREMLSVIRTRLGTPGASDRVAAALVGTS
jgi:lipid-A-disaccharide synthase